MKKDSARRGNSTPCLQRPSRMHTFAIEQSCGRSILQHQCVGSRESGLPQFQANIQFQK